MKTYIITRAGVNHTSKTTPVKVEIMIKGRVKKQKPFIYYKPGNLDFGISGPGSANLALTILMDYFEEQPTRSELEKGDFKAFKYRQRFNSRFITPEHGQSFTITANQIEKFMEEVNG